MRGPDFCRSQPQKTQKQHKIGRLKARNFTKKRINFAKRENVCIFALPKRKKWSDGRVARHSSAKAATAVRIRFRPQKTLLQALVEGIYFFTPFFTPLLLLIITSPDTPKVNKIVSSAKIRTIRL